MRVCEEVNRKLQFLRSYKATHNIQVTAKPSKKQQLLPSMCAGVHLRHTLQRLHVYLNKYYLQYERPCCIGYTKPSRRQEIVCPIQHEREYCKVLVRRMNVLVENPRDTNDFRRENERKVYVNQQNFVSVIQLLIKRSSLVSSLHKLLMIFSIATFFKFYF